MRSILIALLFATAPLHAATLDVRPDSRVVGENETFQLSIRIDGSTKAVTPDLTALERDFEIVGQRTASQFRSINGRIDSWTDWVLTLRPRRTGRLVIPALKLGALESAPISIEVKPLDAQTKRQLAQMVRFETELAPKPVYVQAQLVVTRRLVYAEGAQLYGELPGDPVIEGAVVRSIGDARHTTEVRDGKRFGVIAQRFVVFPERSGTLVVPGVAIVASVNLPRRDGAGFARREVRVASDPLEVTVRPVPSSYPKDAPWLPAEQVEVVEDWQASGEWQVGAPRTRALIVRADATAASRIAPIRAHYGDELKVYADPPNISEQLGPAGVIGIRSETARLVPTRPGAIELPGVEITWWNTSTDALATATLPPRLEKVVGEPMARIDETGPASTTVPRAQVRPDTVEASSELPFTALWIAGLTAVAALLAWLMMRGYRATPLRKPSSDYAKPLSERTTYRQLRDSCRRGDLHAIRKALDGWLEVLHGDRGSGVAAFAEGQARPIVAALDATLYGTGSVQAFDPKALMSAARMHRRECTRNRRTPRAAALPGLYPGTAT